MYTQWNATATARLKRAYFTASGAELFVILAIVLLARLGTRTPEVVLPGPAPQIIVVRPVDLRQPPTIELPDPTPVPKPVAQPEVPSGLYEPAPDSEATQETAPTTSELGDAYHSSSKLDSATGPNVKLVVETGPALPPPEPPDNEIPTPTTFVKTIRNPVPQKLAVPEYPDNCRRLGIEGRAVINLLLDLNGTVMTARIVQSAGYAELDSSAVRAGRKSVFTPAIGGHNKPVRVWVTIPVNFRLE